MRRDKRSEYGDLFVSVEVEASELLRGLAGEADFGAGNVKAAIRKAAMSAGFTFTRTRKLWYREARSILAQEMDQLRAKAASSAKERRNELGRQHMDVSRRLDELEASLAEMQARFTGATPSYARGETDARG